MKAETLLVCQVIGDQSGPLIPDTSFCSIENWAIVPHLSVLTIGSQTRSEQAEFLGLNLRKMWVEITPSELLRYPHKHTDPRDFKNPWGLLHCVSVIATLVANDLHRFF